MNSRLRKITGAVLLVTATACYTTVPVSGFPPREGRTMVVQLTPDGTTGMAAHVGPRIVAITGKVLSSSGDTLALSVSTVTRSGGDDSFWQGELVRIPRQYIGSIGEQRISVLKSGLVAAGIAGLAALIRSAVTNTQQGKTPTVPPVGQ